jgi:hypothetical protein
MRVNPTPPFDDPFRQPSGLLPSPFLPAARLCVRVPRDNRTESTVLIES